MRSDKAQNHNADASDSKYQYSDAEVLHQLRIGNTRAYQYIMRRYNQRLYRVARSILNDNDSAEDALQQTYISAYFKLDQYSDDVSFGAWLTRITINEALMIKRKPCIRSTVTDGSLDQKLIDDRNKPEYIQSNKELAQLIESAIESLPEEFRSVFILRAIQQCSVSETAQSLNIHETTVKTRLHRARKLMQNTLNQYIEHAGLQVYEFAGQRCDHMVKAVLNTLELYHGAEHSNNWEFH